MNRRIRRPSYQEDIYRELTNSDDIGLFNTYKDVFIFGAILGFLEGERVEFEKSLELISWNVFNLRTDKVIINLIYFGETGSIEELYEEDEEAFDLKMKVVEEYAASGAAILYKRIQENPTRAKEALIDFLEEIDQIEESEDGDQNIDIIGRYLN